MKHLTAFILLTIFIVSCGCRMCGSEYDYCMSAIVNGKIQNAGPLYRAGSILNDMSENYCYDNYFADPDCIDCKSNNSFDEIEYNDVENNNFITPNISNNSSDSSDSSTSSTNRGWQGTNSGTNIGIPTTPQQNNGNGNKNNNNNIPNKQDQNFRTPTLEELMKPTPPRPITSPKNTIPFNTPQKPNTDIAPDNFTIENLRQLDPSVNDSDVQEVKIIKIEDTTLRRR